MSPSFEKAFVFISFSHALNRSICCVSRATYRLNQPPVLHQRLLVFDVIALEPCLDLVAVPLQLLDLRLEVRLQLLFLALVRRGLELVVQALKDLDTFRDLFKGPIDFGWGSVAARTHSAAFSPPSFTDPWKASGATARAAHVIGNISENALLQSLSRRHAPDSGGACRAAGGVCAAPRSSRHAAALAFCFGRAWRGEGYVD